MADTQPPRLGRHDLVSLRRSLAMSPSLTADHARALIDELERLLDERTRLRALVERIEAPYREARTLLVELSRLLH